MSTLHNSSNSSNVSDILPAHIQEKLQLSVYHDPLTKQAFNISIDNTLHMINVNLHYCAGNRLEYYKHILTQVLQTEYPNYTYDWKIQIKPHMVKHGIERVKGIKNIIAVISGKGGVGKSTTAVNLALSLMQQGYGQVKVGILDADIYGPSIPTLLGIQGQKPKIDENKNMLPIFAHGLLCNSIGLVVADNAPTIWRGPMATGAFNQLLQQTVWGDLDYLVIDMPPGTGDIQLTLAQKVPVTAAVVVTTPQTIASLDAQKGLAMLSKVNIHIAGVIENMSQHICSNCGHIEHIFAGDGGQYLADFAQVKMLAQLPLDANIAKHSDLGLPIVLAQPQHDISKMYHDIAIKLSADLSLLKKDSLHLFKVVATNNE
jgi:ATP-binding protein involved in chromosome partitioning